MLTDKELIMILGSRLMQIAIEGDPIHHISEVGVIRANVYFITGEDEGAAEGMKLVKYKLRL